MIVKILFKAIGSRKTVDDICDNFHENYPKFASNMNEKIYDHNKKTNEFTLMWSGNFNNLTNADIDTLTRLTHQAEGFYENTDAEYVHVEVYINNTWYGR